MASFVGADVEELGALASIFERKAQALHQMTVASSASLMVAEWVGADIDRIRSEWNRDSKPTMLKVACQLSGLARALRKQAEDQRAASAPPSPSSRFAVDPTPAVTTASDRYLLARNSGDDGVRIQGVMGADGVIRYVVYLDGTDPSSKGLRKITDNSSELGFSTETGRYIDDKMREAIPDGAEVMVVGYSQGGIYAQQVASSTHYRVTDVLTFGTPFTDGVYAAGGANIVQIRDGRDPIPLLDGGQPLTHFLNDVHDNIGIAWQSLLGDDAGAVARRVEQLDQGRHLTFETWAPDSHVTSLLGSHPDPVTYVEGGDQYEERAAGTPEGREVLQSQARYSGQVVSDTDGTTS
jgi:hypothetical protein